MLGVIHRYAHGSVVVPVALACRDAGLFRLLESERRVSFGRLTDELHANAGHLRVAMLVLESLGTVARQSDDYILIGSASGYHRIPDTVRPLLSFPMSSYLSGSDDVTLRPWLDLSRASWNIGGDPLVHMLDGVIVTALMSALAPLAAWGAMSTTAALWDALERGGTRVPHRVRTELAGFFHAQGWSTSGLPDARLTATGSFLFSRPFLFGIVGSYRPMLARMDDLLFGDCTTVFARNALEHEQHVDRRLNVHGSGQQHAKYFGDLDGLIVELFDTETLETQPAYVADMGCGDGSLLRHVHDIVVHRTRRGRHLQRFPLRLIGIDFNQEPLVAAAATLRGLDPLLLTGDIGKPDELIAELHRQGIHDPENVLHIRSFMDHDRPYVAPSDRDAAASNRERIPFESAFVDRQGGEIHPADAYRSLVEHLQRWSSVLARHPLIVLETHSLSPGVVRRHVNECENLHFDACQRFSHQLLMDANHFLLAAAESSLFARGGVKRHPRTLGFTRITLTAFERRGYRVRWARLDDMAALERLEQDCWAPALQTPPFVLRERIQKYPHGQFVVEMDDRVVGALYTQRLTDANALASATSDTVDQHHRDRGTVVQLLGLNIAPSAQQFGLGDHLLELVLQYHELSSDVQAIVGVTRCKEYGKYRHLSYGDYIARRDDNHLLIDPVLRFHELHGAVIQRPLAGYRPADTDNEGCGVLIEYAPNARRRQTAAVAPTHQVTDVEIEAFLRQTVSRILDRDESQVLLDRPLMDLGLDSLGLTELGVHVGNQFGRILEPTFFFHHHTLASIAAFLGNDPMPPRTDSRRGSHQQLLRTASEEKAAVAIVGIACRLPGGINHAEQLWRALVERRSLVGSVADIAWRWSGIARRPADATLPLHVAHIDGIEHFDAAFFSISPAEATLMDPQQRIMLELSWECVEDAGYDVRALAGSAMGVFVGASGSDYKTLQDKTGRDVEAHYALATSTSVIPNRISYAFDFCGPSVQTDTACSSSLVAIHQAVRSLLEGECDAALAGGISLICEPSNSIAYQRAGMLAPDGRCKTFDAGSNGYVRGEGAVVFLLKPLAKARADKDRIYATIIGSAVNHGGRAAGLTAPNPRQHAEVLTAAWRTARITADRLGYIEAHGTGTALGDPVEIEGLNAAFTAAAPPADGRTSVACAIGSIKTNIGHLEAAAGVAGLLKAVLCLRHREIPATLNFHRLNPRISLESSPLLVSIDHQTWEPPPQGTARVAGVSSFGSGGTNAHVVVQELTDDAARPAQAQELPDKCLILLSATTENALRQREADLLAWLAADDGRHRLDAVGATLALGRAHFEYRSAYVVASVAELVDKLAAAGRNPARIGDRRVPSSSTVRANPLLQRVTRLVLEDLRTGAGRRGEAYHQDLQALAELYRLGLDVDWQALFFDTMEQRLGLPTYPFEKERYWLSESSSTPPRLESEWCCLTEHWIPAPIPQDVDWERQLSRWHRARIVVVYDDEADKDALTSLLARVMSSDAQLGSKAEPIRAVHQRDMGHGDAVSVFDPAPDVVFCLGPRPTDGPVTGSVPVATAFHVSRALMQRAWDHPIRLFYIFDESASHPRIDCEALTGFMRSAMLENSRHAWKLIAFAGAPGHLTRHQALVQELLSEAPMEPADGVAAGQGDPACEVRYDDSGRSVRRLLETALPPLTDGSASMLQSLGFRQRGTYLITGGLGPVGEQLCEQLARRFQPTLVLLSRSALDARREQTLARFRSLGATVHYFPVDVADKASLARAVQVAKDRVGAIHGVVHLARLVDDELVASKSWASFERVIEAKVAGTVLLDELTAGEPLDLFMLFSSIAANGLRGSCDYAYSAAFQNAFARYRRQLERSSQRPGRTIAFAWGPWVVDSYQAAGRTERFAAAGLDLLDIGDACRAMDRAGAQQDPVMYLLKVLDRSRVRQHMHVLVDEPVNDAVATPWQDLEDRLGAFEALRNSGREVVRADILDLLAKCDVESMPQRLVDRADRLLFADEPTPSSVAVESAIEVRSVLRDSVAEVLKLPLGYDDQRTLQSLGLDSVSAMQLATRVEAKLGIAIQPRWFLEFSTIPVLAEHLAGLMPLPAPE